MKPIWTYGIELWLCASKSSVAIIQRSQSKMLRMLTNAPWNMTNHSLHEDLLVLFVKDVIKARSIKHHDMIENHINILL